MLLFSSYTHFDRCFEHHWGRIALERGSERTSLCNTVHAAGAFMISSPNAFRNVRWCRRLAPIRGTFNGHDCHHGSELIDLTWHAHVPQLSRCELWDRGLGGSRGATMLVARDGGAKVWVSTLRQNLLPHERGIRISHSV
jgi:hypothetical protein